MSRFDFNPPRQLDIDLEALVDAAEHDRQEALGQSLRQIGSRWPITRRGVSIVVTAFLVAAGMFWTIMLTTPPTSEASGKVTQGPSLTSDMPQATVSCDLANACP